MNYQIILTYSSITYFLVAVRDLTDFFYRCFIFAGIEGFEPTTLGLTGHSSNHCSYIPKLIIKSSYTSSISIICGPEENRTLHSLLAREKRQPWNMRAHIFKINDFVFVRVVGLEPTYREDQYELFVEAGRFYRPLPLHSQLFEPVFRIELKSSGYKTEIITIILYRHFFIIIN